MSHRFHQASDGQPRHRLDPGCTHALREPRLCHHRGGRASAGSRVCPISSPTGLDTIIRALKELQLSALEARAPERDQLLDFDFERLEHQLAMYLGPHPSWEDMCALTFSFINIRAALPQMS
jgi:hypothetical protein